jgi:hypothetical protein
MFPFENDSAPTMLCYRNTWQSLAHSQFGFPKDLLERLRRVARRKGVPMAQIVRESLEKTLAQHSATAKDGKPWMEHVGVIKGGPSDLSSRKGFFRPKDEQQ